MNNASFEFNKQLELDVLVNGLTEVTGKYVDKFSDRYHLTDVIIPKGVKSIEAWAFEYCRGLKNITVPRSVTSLGTYAFGARYKPLNVLFEDRSLDGVRSMSDYPWGLSLGKITATEF